MPYRLKQQENIETGIRRIADEQLSKAINELQDATLDRHAQVHQVRKRFKKIRGLLRLVRPGFGETYGQNNAWYRDAGRQLSPVRDAESMLEALNRLEDRYQKPLDADALNDIEAWFKARRRKVADDWNDVDADLAILSDELEQMRQEVAKWSLSGDDKEIVFGGMKKTYRRAYQSRRDALSETNDETLHEWRKHVKYHWYHSRLLCGIWEPIMKARIEVFDELGDLLGADHDLAVMNKLIDKNPQICRSSETVELFLGLSRQRRKLLQQKAFRLGALACTEKPAALCRRLAAYWDVWKT